MTAQELRASLLREAVTGRLVPQRAEEGSTETLYEEIRQEKARLIAEKKIKKEKPLPPVTEAEQPFSIPSTWKWVRLPEIAQILLGKTLNKAKDSGTLHPYLCSINVTWQGIKLDTVKEALFTKVELEKYQLHPGDLLICEGGDIGRTAVWEKDIPMYYQNALHRVRFFAGLSPYFFRAIMEYYKKIGLLDKFCKGVTIKHLVQSSLCSLVFPLPPLAEQKRIVDKLEELLPLVNAYGKAEQRLAAYEDRFPDALKRSLLQEAVTGRLVPQRAEEGSAEALYEEIRQEKARLIAEKKIKKEKPLPPVTEEEQPFPIPASWKWIRLEDVCSMKITDGTHQTPKYATKDNGIPFLSAKDITTQKICWDNIKYITTDLHEELYKRIAPQKDDVLLAKNGTTGVAALVEEDKIFDIYVTLAVLRPEKRLILPQFLWRLVNSPVCKRQFDSHLKGIGVPNLHLTEIRKILIPLPPLAEQKRIVAKLEELLALAERIREARR